MLISRVFLFDMVCALLSSFQLLGPWLESIGLAEVDSERCLVVGLETKWDVYYCQNTLCCDFRAAAATAAAARVAAVVVAAAVVATAAGSGGGGGGGWGGGGCTASRVARTGSRRARAGPLSASANNSCFSMMSLVISRFPTLPRMIMNGERNEVIPCFVVCPLCFAFDMYSLGDKSDDIYSACAGKFELEPCLVVCPWCFAQAGLTLYTSGSTSRWMRVPSCAHAVGWLHAGWVDLTSAPST